MAERRVRRKTDVPTVLLQARVDPAVRDAVKEAAARSGVTIAYYVEHFLQDLIEERGELPSVENPRAQKERLPMTAA